MMDDDQVDVGWCIKREGEADIVGGELFSPTCRWHNVRSAIWRQLGPEQTRPANHAIVVRPRFREHFLTVLLTMLWRPPPFLPCPRVCATVPRLII